MCGLSKDAVPSCGRTEHLRMYRPLIPALSPNPAAKRPRLQHNPQPPPPMHHGVRPPPATQTRRARKPSPRAREISLNPDPSPDPAWDDSSARVCAAAEARALGDAHGRGLCSPWGSRAAWPGCPCLYWCVWCPCDGRAEGFRLVQSPDWPREAGLVLAGRGRVGARGTSLCLCWPLRCVGVGERVSVTCDLRGHSFGDGVWVGAEFGAPNGD
jgi:hypothetical protein